MSRKQNHPSRWPQAIGRLGAFSTLAGIAIATAKTLLVMTFFMRVKTESPLLRIVAVIGFAWLFVLIGLSVVELLTRSALVMP